MTKPVILETLARAIHCHDGRLPTPWDADMIARWPDDCEYERKEAESQAAAAMELPEVRALVEAVTRQVENIDDWLATSIPAGPIESKSIYDQLSAALAAAKEVMK